jgi:hypothetical protein
MKREGQDDPNIAGGRWLAVSWRAVPDLASDRRPPTLGVFASTFLSIVQPKTWEQSWTRKLLMLSEPFARVQKSGLGLDRLGQPRASTRKDGQGAGCAREPPSHGTYSGQYQESARGPLTAQQPSNAPTISCWTAGCSQQIRSVVSGQPFVASQPCSCLSLRVSDLRCRR